MELCSYDGVGKENRHACMHVHVLLLLSLVQVHLKPPHIYTGSLDPSFYFFSKREVAMGSRLNLNSKRSQIEGLF